MVRLPSGEKVPAWTEIEEDGNTYPAWLVAEDVAIDEEFKKMYDAMIMANQADLEFSSETLKLLLPEYLVPFSERIDRVLPMKEGVYPDGWAKYHAYYDEALKNHGVTTRDVNMQRSTGDETLFHNVKASFYEKMQNDTSYMDKVRVYAPSVYADIMGSGQ